MKEKVTNLFTDFFQMIGIDPYLGFLIVLCIMLVFKIRGYLIGKEKDKWDYFYDITFFIVSVGLIIFFTLYLFGYINV